MTDMTETLTGAVRKTRTAKLRLVHLDPWSVGKTVFVLSLALGLTMVVATVVLWILLSASGVWGSINSAVNSTAAGSGAASFDITHYLGLGRVFAFSLVSSLIEVVVVTLMSVLVTILFNLASLVFGGVEVTFAEER